jgi:type IX secretion system PorP/SprF family membrane protein
MLSTEWRLGTGKSAVGLAISSEKSGIISNNMAFITYAPHFQLTKTQKLSFGISGGVRQNSIAFDRVNAFDEGDAILFGQNQNSTNFDVNAGFTYKVGGMTLQGVGLQLLGNKSTYSNSFLSKELDFRYIRHYFGSISYEFVTKKNLKFTPIIQARGIEGLPLQPEGIIKFDYKDQFWAAGHYRHEAAYGFSAGVHVNKTFTIGYSGELSPSNFVEYNGGTHELVFGVKLGGAYQSLINKQRLDKLSKTTASYDERIEYMKRENEKMQETIDKQKTKIEEIKNSQGELSYDDIKKLLDEARELDSKESEVKETEVEKAPVIFKDYDSNKVNTPNKKYYTILATEAGKKDAFKSQRLAKSKFGLDTYVIKVEGDKYYYVTLGGSDVLQDCVDLKDNLKQIDFKNQFNGYPWILRVKE